MTREELYQKFGPELMEAIVRVQIKENNIIRQHLGLPLLTGQQVINAITHELENIPDYPWMSEI